MICLFTHDMRKVKTIQKRSLADEVADQIQTQIEKGKMKRGEKLPIEPELMQMFGVGRSTIREAVKMLVNRGLLDVQQGRGTFVANTLGPAVPWEQRLEQAKIKDFREVRNILESSIVMLAAERRTDEDLKTMRLMLDERKAAAEENRLDDCLEADARFHLAVASATHNELISTLYKTLAASWPRFFGPLYDDTSRMRDSQQKHEDLYEAIENGNKEETRTAMDVLLHAVWTE
jgi:DNA-binding FadR family transcriptional regulator